MNNFGIGVDCVDIHRFNNRKENFLRKVFTKLEREYCINKSKPEQHFAGKFAAKEAVVKALYSLNCPITVTEIEILNDIEGRPYVKVVQSFADNFDIKISLSHSDNTAIAFAIAIQ